MIITCFARNECKKQQINFEEDLNNFFSKTQNSSSRQLVTTCIEKEKCCVPFILSTDYRQLLYSHICYVVASNFHDDLRTFFTNKKIPIFFPGTGKCVKNTQ